MAEMYVEIFEFLQRAKFEKTGGREPNALLLHPELCVQLLDDPRSINKVDQSATRFMGLYLLTSKDSDLLNPVTVFLPLNLLNSFENLHSFEGMQDFIANVLNGQEPSAFGMADGIEPVEENDLTVRRC